jgi:type I restriction enzyme, S subunit
MGKTPPRSEKIYWEGPAFPWVSIGDMSPYGTIMRTAESVSDTAHRKIFRAQLVPAGHTLMSFKLTIGRVARLGISAYHNEAIISFRPDHPDVDEDFLFYYLSQIEYAAYRDKAIKGDTLNKSKLKILEIALPPLHEQRQIAALLSAVQRAVEQQERLIALTTELKKALMHKLFTEGTRGEPLKRTEIGPVPESWKIVRLDHVATIERGKFSHRPRNAPEFYGGDVPFVQTGDVSKCDGRIRKYTQTLNERGLAVSRMFPKGTILITIAANIGYAGLLEFDSACTDSLVAITPILGDNAEFLNHYLQTQQPVMDRLAPQGTQKNINIQFLKPWPIPRPSPDEQAAISDALNRIDGKRRRHEQKLDALSSLFRTLLHQLMTAQIRVHDLDLSVLDEAQQESVGAV